MVVPLLAPCLWGLFNRRLPTGALWATVGICFPLGIFVRFIMPAGTEGITGWIAGNSKMVETFIGVILPLIITALSIRLARRDSPGWQAVAALQGRAAEDAPPPGPASPLPIVGGQWRHIAHPNIPRLREHFFTNGLYPRDRGELSFRNTAGSLYHPIKIRFGERFFSQSRFE
jgi:hypothetical protein